MADNAKHLNTVEELVAHVMGLSSYGQERKWTLHVQRDTKWADEQAGLTYEAVESKLRDARDDWSERDVELTVRRAVNRAKDVYAYSAITEDEAQAYVASLPEGDPIKRFYTATEEERQANYAEAQAAIDAHQPPARVNVSHYSLETASTMYHSGDALYLSEELGATCDKVWKHGPVAACWSPKGYMTLAGLLKRLGRSDVSEQVKTAQAIEAERQAKQHRNYARAEIVKRLNEIEKLLDKDGAALGLTKADFMLSVDVTAKLMEE